MQRYLSLMAVFLFICVGLSYAQELSEPEKNFEYLWISFNKNYAIFGPKKVDWKALYKVYRPKVNAQTSDDELFEIMSNMLGHLNDNHIRLNSENPARVFIAGILNEILKEKEFKNMAEAHQFLNKRPVDSVYFKGELKERMNGMFAFGWVSEGIGYFHFKGFRNISESTTIIDEIISTFKDANGIIVDVRKNSGGDDRVGKLIADRFADRKRLYMITYTRNGPNYNDFTPPKYLYVEPDGPYQFTKPVVLLINRFSISAAENFALAMRVLPHATLVGDFTSGVFADIYRDVLPNGWRFTVPYKLFVDHNGFCWEGIGVPPDLRILNKEEEGPQGKDQTLKFAVELLNSGSLELQDESGSLQNIRESLAKTLRTNIAQNGVDSAVKEFYDAKKKDADTYYVDAEEMDTLGDELIEAGKMKEALEVFKLNAEEHPAMWWVHRKLGQIYVLLGDKKSGSKSYDKASELNPRSFPWEKEAVYTVQLEQALFTEGVGSAKEKFLDLKQNYPDFARIAEQVMNRLGYELLRLKRIKDAIAILKINVQSFPGSWNVYDSLAEAYMESGNKQLAIQNYEKSIELNPENINGKNKLKQLKER
ncbi:MAG: tetratricopeptide repeat protein [Candidatus Aenigmarchaeota archaeon]|nr:tetratricopeptide repeat protein [Candidatus Aenigmarchaeota archaeon]